MSPYIFQSIAVLTVLLGLPAVAILGTYLFRRLQSQERIRAIEKGLIPAFDPREVAWRTRRSGVVLIGLSIGIALALIFVAVLQRDGSILQGLVLAIIPFCLGVSLLYDYRSQLSDLRSPQDRREK